MRVDLNEYFNENDISGVYSQTFTDIEQDIFQIQQNLWYLYSVDVCFLSRIHWIRLLWGVEFVDEDFELDGALVVSEVKGHLFGQFGITR